MRKVNEMRKMKKEKKNQKTMNLEIANMVMKIKTDVIE